MKRSSGSLKPFSAEPVIRTLFVVMLRAAAAVPPAGTAGAQPLPGATGSPDSAAPAAPRPALPPLPPAPGPTLWIDFEKNSDRLTSPQAIEALVDTAYHAG